ncbi:DNA ligase D [Amycolatopsis sp. cg5]|uniref:DNA ligase D n=1 Tax=Amycolatopsis sp. cg5 TaxID=3238802 RepID=UPI003523FCC4
MARADRPAVPDWVNPMLAKPDGGRLPTGSSWVYEYKLDGYRCCMRIAPDGTTVLTSRNNLDFTDEFTEVTGVLGAALGGEAAVLDGEIVVYNEHGQPEFGRLQERRGRFAKHQSSPHRGEPFTDDPVRFIAFDLLRLGDRSLLGEPYEERRRLLTGLPMPDLFRVAVVRAFTFDELAADRRSPQQLLEHVAAAGFEGLVAKLRGSTYLPGKRSDGWQKHPLVQTQEVIICGWRPGQRSFTGTLGGLLLGAHHPDTGELVYLGDVGTGFSHAARAELMARLEPTERRHHPFAIAPPREDVVRAHWVEPKLVGEVVYRQFTRGAGRLRHTAWRGLRADKKPSDVIAPRSEPRTAPTAAEPEPAPPKRITVQVGPRQLTLSNLDKPLYPDGFTKGEVIHYYSHIAPVLLPHLAGRPVTFIRFPNGVGGQQFYEKNAAKGAPSWLKTATLPSTGSRGTGGTIDYPLLDGLPALVWAANLAALELHVPQWQVGRGSVKRPPDRLVFDLDPGEGTTIVDCARVAERLHDILAADGLTPVAKTSGSKGMQLYCGIRTRSPETPSAYAKALADQLAAETPELVVSKMTKALRPGKVFIDWSQNNPAKTTVAPYSLRGRDQPTVSTPLTWDEVRACRSPDQLVFTADDVLERVERLGDLFAVIDETRVALPRRS